MENRQLEHIEIKNLERSFPLTVICENLKTPENVGVVFRICEAMGVERIILTGTSITPPNRKITKVSRSTDKKLPYSYFENTVLVINNLRKENYKILALEITDNSQQLCQSQFRADNKYALIIGSEKDGVATETLKYVDLSLEISLFGKNTSINVVSALSIALYEITKQIAK